MLFYDSLRKWKERLRTELFHQSRKRGTAAAVSLFLLLGVLLALAPNVSNVVAEHRPVLISGFYLQNDSIYLMNYLAYENGNPVGGAQISLYFSRQMIETGDTATTASDGYANYSLFFRATYLSQYEYNPVEKYSVRCQGGTYNGTVDPVLVSAPNPGVVIDQIFPGGGNSVDHFLVVNFHRKSINSQLETGVITTPNGDFYQTYNFSRPVQVISIPVGSLGCVRGFLNYGPQGYSQDSTTISPSGSLQMFSDFIEGSPGNFITFMIPLSGIVVGYAVFGREVAEGTMDSVLVRPVTRREIVLTRYTSGAVGLAVLYMILMTASFAVLTVRTGYYSDPLPFAIYALVSAAASGALMSLMFLISTLRLSKNMVLVAGFVLAIFLLIGVEIIGSLILTVSAQYANGGYVMVKGDAGTAFSILFAADPANLANDLLPFVYYAEIPALFPSAPGNSFSLGETLLGSNLLIIAIISTVAWVIIPVKFCVRMWQRKE